MADTTSILGTVLEGVLDAAQDALTAAALPVPASPGIVHTAPVVPLGAEGCSDVLAVWLDRIVARPGGEGTASSPGERQMAGWHSVALLRVQLWRCHAGLTDTGSPPSDAEMNADALRLARGAWAIWVEIGARRQADTLVSLPGDAHITQRDIGMGSMTPLAPTGYTAGWQLNLEVGLPAVLE